LLSSRLVDQVFYRRLEDELRAEVEGEEAVERKSRMSRELARGNELSDSLGKAEVVLMVLYLGRITVLCVSDVSSTVKGLNADTTTHLLAMALLVALSSHWAEQQEEYYGPRIV